MLQTITAPEDKSINVDRIYPNAFEMQVSVGVKNDLGKENDLSIVILWLDYLTRYKVI